MYLLLVLGVPLLATGSGSLILSGSLGLARGTANSGSGASAFSLGGGGLTGKHLGRFDLGDLDRLFHRRFGFRFDQLGRLRLLDRLRFGGRGLGRRFGRRTGVLGRGRGRPLRPQGLADLADEIDHIDRPQVGFHIEQAGQDDDPGQDQAVEDYGHTDPQPQLASGGGPPS